MSYDANSIESLSFRDGVRRRINMYLGSNDIEGTYQALKEIINNSTDEALAGYGDKIIITVDEKTNEISVEDFGRGVPFLVKEDGTNVLVDIYTKAHTGGKFNHDSYKNASGLNGCGGGCVCLSSEKFTVVSTRDGKRATAIFEKGNNISYKEEKADKKKHGTLVCFIPDKEVFSEGDIGYSYNRICQEIKDISYLYPGLTFVIENKTTGTKETYCAKSGIADFVKDNVEKPLHQHIIYIPNITDGQDTVEIAFQWGCKKERSYVFVNGLRCPEGGAPITGAKTAITKTFNSLSNGDYDGDKIRENLFYVINCKVTNPSFANQTKTKINNANLRTLASKAFTEGLKKMQSNYPKEFTSIVALMDKVTKAERAAERARDAILNHEKEAVAATKKKIVSTNKLRDAKKLGQDSILLAVEGLSAGGSMSIGRDPSKYGIFLMRGKGINCYTNSIEDVLANEEIKILLQALGIVYGKTYNPSKLRYGKLAIASDADADGANIGLLLMVALQVLCPQFIQEGRLYWLKSPLYIVDKNEKREYYYTEEEFRNRKENGGVITRVKGLGQLAERDLKDSMFNPQWQHLEQLIPDEESIETLEQLMGDDVKPRKEFVTNNIDFGEFVYG